MKTIELDSLVGLHRLSGVDRTTTRAPADDYYQDAAVLNFVLDEITYTAVENPEDGYRSSLGELWVTDKKLENMFEATVVFAHKRMSQGYCECDILDFYDVYNGKLVMSIGTDNVNDYYPMFVADFDPRNLYVNEGKE